MSVEIIECDFKKKVSAKINLRTEGIGRYKISSPFRFDDGDHLVIILRREGDGWILSDEGHTFMHLTYDLTEKQLYEGTRFKIITNVLSSFSVQNRAGELMISISNGQYGDALYSFVQALLKITDVRFLKHEIVKSAFLEDFREFIEGAVSRERLAVGWHEPTLDPEGRYAVDYRINGISRPLFIYALTNNDRVRDATIALHQLERWDLRFRSVGVFEDEEEIDRRVLARFGDICEKLYSNLPANRDRIKKYLLDIIGETV